MLSYSSVLLVLAAATSSAVAAPGLKLAVSGPTHVDGVDNLAVVATLTNTGDETLRLVNEPNTILTPSWKTNMFDIESAEGVVPEFKGVAVKFNKHSAAKNQKWTKITPGESVDFTHALGGVYNFTSAGESSYKISASSIGSTFSYVREDGSLVAIKADLAEPHTAKLAGKVVPTSYAGPNVEARGLSKRANSFVSCSSTRQTQLKAAAPNAQTYANGAVSYLTSHTATSARFVTWFGTWTSAHRTTVLSHYTNIANGQLASDTFDCTCTEADTYAYVYPDTFGYIYLCGYYWNAPATGTDSQAGTLIHESSHFTKNGGTEDYVYGQSAAQSLAKSNSGEAIFNADNHEYFAENNPSQS